MTCVDCASRVRATTTAMDLVTQIQEQFREKDDKIRRLESNEAALGASLEQLRNELNARLADHEQSTAMYEQELDTLKARHVALQNTNQTLRGRIGELERSVRSAQKDVQDVVDRERDMRESWLGERETLEERVRKAQGEREDISKVLDKERLQANMSRRDREKLEERFERMETELVIARARLDPTENTAVLPIRAADDNLVSSNKTDPLSPSRKQSSTTPPTPHEITNLSHASLLKVHTALQSRFNALRDVYNTLRQERSSDLEKWKNYKRAQDEITERRKKALQAAKEKKRIKREQRAKEEAKVDDTASPTGKLNGAMDVDEQAVPHHVNVDSAQAAQHLNEAQTSAVSHAKAPQKTHTSPGPKTQPDVLPAPTRTSAQPSGRLPGVLQSPSLTHLNARTVSTVKSKTAGAPPERLQPLEPVASTSQAPTSETHIPKVTPAKPIAATSTPAKSTPSTLTPGGSKNILPGRISPWLGAPNRMSALKPKAKRRPDSFEEERYDNRKSRQTPASDEEQSPPPVFQADSPLVRDRGGAKAALKRKAGEQSCDLPDPKRTIQITHQMMDPRAKARHKKKLEAQSMTIGKEVYEGYKPKSRDAPGAPVEHPPIAEVYEINPDANGGLNYAYNQTVRKKDERRRLHGTDCECCSEYWKLRGNIPVPRGPIWRDPQPGEEEEQLVGPSEPNRETSRHREQWAHHPTPPGYWDIGFPNTPAVETMNLKADRLQAEKEDKIRRQAERSDGQWRKKIKH